MNRRIRHSTAVCMMCALGWNTVAADEQNARTARIVGLGAATCRQFVTDAAADPQVRKDYLAWAQGFMSGIILSRPPGVDVGLDPNPPTFGLVDQLRFLEDHCIGIRWSIFPLPSRRSTSAYGWKAGLDARTRMMKTDRAEGVRYRVTGMDCPACAAKIEAAARSIAGVRDAKVSIASQEMTLQTEDGTAPLPEVERSIPGLGYRLARVDDGEDDDNIPDLSHVTPAYRRALWIVVLLNAGYGGVEIVGGFLAGSQSVKADALDFIGDGVISFLGLIAVGWGLAARAKAALLQGIFLGVLGVGVLVATAYRMLVHQQPEAGLMGILALIGLAVNVMAAVVLLPHRQGDANVRAVWLFSRNDTIGNVAVVIAALLVAWTQSPWPDLVVAIVMAALFLQSALSIIRDARNDLSEGARIRPGP